MKMYEIVFSGQLVPGAQLDRVQANLAKLFQADAQRIALLFSGRRLVLKNNLDQAAAEKYRSTLERAGAKADVVEMPGQIDVPAPAEMEVEEVELAPPPDEPTWTRKTSSLVPGPGSVAKPEHEIQARTQRRLYGGLRRCRGAGFYAFSAGQRRAGPESTARSTSTGPFRPQPGAGGQRHGAEDGSRTRAVAGHLAFKAGVIVRRALF